MSVCVFDFRRQCASVLSFCLAVLATLSLSSTARAQNAAVNFTDSQPVPLANACNGALTGRFHNSTQLDLITNCSPSNGPGPDPTTTALLNQGNGTFKPIVDTAINTIATPVLTADMNGDGYSDLIVEQTYGSTVIGVQLSNGDGTFKAPVFYTPTPFDQYAVFLGAVTGDFNGDGKPDVAILSNTSATTTNNTVLTIFLNTGTGGLKQAATYAMTNANQPAMLVAGKLNGDSETDLAILYPGSTSVTVVPYFATGSGTFKAQASHTLSGTLYGVAIAEFTSDGYGDIAVTTSKGIQVLLGSSSGAFSAAPTTPYPSTITTARQLVAADFDKDGKTDLAALGGSQLLVFWGAGNGTFSSNSAFSENNALTLTSADINHDGFIDLAAAEYSGSVHILSNLGARNFRGAPATSSANATGIVAADFNKDGKKDIAVVNTPTCNAPCNGTVTVFAATTGSYFAAGKKYSIGMHGQAIAAGDLNGDGFLDLVVTDATPGDNADTSVLMGTSGGGFASAKNYTLGSLSNVAYLVDMNGDGKLDLVEAGGVALGKGDGTFSSLIPFPNGIGFGSSTGSFNLYLGVGHFNAGSTPDVAVAYNSGQNGWEVFALIGDGTGHFTATQLGGTQDILQTVQGLTVGKLKTGGPDDIVVANSAAKCCGSDGGAVFFGEPVIFFGNGSGSFSDATEIGPQTDGSGVGGVAIADFNRDGLPDIGMISADQFAVAPGIDGVNFSTTQVFSSTSGPSFASSAPGEGNLVVADFNGDQSPDVVTTNQYGITRLYDVRVPTVSPGSLTWNSGGTQNVTIKNTATTAQALQVAIAGLNPKSFAITSNTCNTTLAVGASCTVTVEYIPGQGTSPAPQSTLWIRDNGAFIAEIPLTGLAG